MESFMVAYTDGKPVPAAAPNGVQDQIAVAAQTCLALGKGIAPTSEEIATAYDIDEGKRTGVVVKISGYHGYATNSIWEKLRSWEALTQ